MKNPERQEGRSTDSATNGYGVLEVQNGTSEDAVLSLYDSAADETIREVYLQARHSVRMKGIPEGTYQLAYTAGLDWDEGEAIFRCDPDYAQFEREFVFTEERDREGIQYRSITVTLHPVVGGNIRTRRMSRFPDRASVVRQTDRRLFRVRRARFTFSRMSAARAVQMNGFGLSLWRSM